MVLKPVPMARVAFLGLRKFRQPVVSILHDLQVLQLEPLSKDVSTLLRNERDVELTSQVSDQLLRVKALLTTLPGITVTERTHFASTKEFMGM